MGLWSVSSSSLRCYLLRKPSADSSSFGRRRRRRMIRGETVVAVCFKTKSFYLLPSSYSSSLLWSHRGCHRIVSVGCNNNNNNNTMMRVSVLTHQKKEEEKKKKPYSIAKAKKGGNSGGSPETSSEESEENKKGSVVGAVSLIIGTSIGSGILALPQKTSPAGFIPSAVTMIVCWGFLTIEALLLVEINVGLRKKRKTDETQRGDLDVISLRTMAQETLGDWGGNMATITYLFLAYTSIVAYTSKSGEVLSHLIHLPTSISGIIFTTLLSLLILVGGIHITDRVNQSMTFSMIGLLVAIEVTAFSFGGWSSLTTMSNWGKVPSTIPVIIFSLVYHDIAPVICAYLGGDLARVRLSIMLGSLVPLVSLLVWGFITQGLSPQMDGVDPLDLLVRGTWSGMLPMVEAFSILAVGTSLIGTLLSFSQFFVEQLDNLMDHSRSTQIQEKFDRDSVDTIMSNETAQYGVSKWWENNKLSFTATSIAVIPCLFISIAVPDAFSTATDIAGGYCMTILYGVLPPAMAWGMHARSCEDDDDDDDKDGSSNDKCVEGDNNGQIALSEAKPALIGVGLFALGIVLEQVLQDLALLL